MPSPPLISDAALEPWVGRAVGRLACEHCRNLYIASFFLPPRKRVAAAAVGAFVHMLEEALAVEARPAPAMGSACASGSDLDQRMQMVRERLDSMYRGEVCPPTEGGPAENAVIAVLAKAVARYQIPQEWLLDLAEAMKMRATMLRFATWSSLQRYLRGRGGAVGLILSAILGLTRSDVQERAVEMGVAVELTRILRDLKNDAARKRIFLPLEDLARFRYGERELAAGVVNQNFIALMQFQIERARGLYRSAAEGICWLGGDGSRLAASAVAVLYSGLLRGIERSGYDIFNHPPRLSPAQRLRRMADAWRLARRRAGDRAVRGWERR